MLDILDVKEGSRVLDPWLGSGTTTQVAAKRGAKSYGFDLNPVMITVARARSARKADIDHARLAWRAAKKVGGGFRPSSPEEQARAIAKHVDRVALELGAPLGRRARAVVSCALMETIRKLRRSTRSSNPTWFKEADPSIRISFAELRILADRSFDRISALFPSDHAYPRVDPVLINGDFNDAVILPNSLDAILTSPPYLTRIDYVKATLPEIEFLLSPSSIEISDLRRRMMGTPLVGSYSTTVREEWGEETKNVLNQIRSHDSKASESYYLSFYLKYFSSLFDSISKISTSLRGGGKACLVVQGSHYKEVPIDLTRISMQMAQNCGLLAADQFDFSYDHSMVNLNSRAKSRSMGVTESALVLLKETGA